MLRMDTAVVASLMSTPARTHTTHVHQRGLTHLHGRKQLNGVKDEIPVRGDADGDGGHLATQRGKRGLISQRQGGRQGLWCTRAANLQYR